ncbi:Serine-rich protein [Coniochaeta hoffmannii]|uniref:Serine-rich protein n=1 Tax=Coniochaeta hoffmannii TaxID=91930 RepID=A0AA38W1U7_9PEZI|nr:Serine-rich protein [Coniochaeta hoffmannii]
MSAQSSRSPDQPAQLNQRSQSQQNNTLAIRIVPYTPPRIVSGAYPRPLSRNRNHVAVNSDGKTFTLVRKGPSSVPSDSRSLISPPLSYSSRTSATSSHERPSIDAWSDDRSSPSLTGGTSATIQDRSLTPYTASPGSSTTQLVADPITSSPWNYRMVGGLRKVPKTPDLKQTPQHHEPPSAPESSLPPLPEISVTPDVETPTRSVAQKASFASDETSSSVFETTNYDIYGHESSVAQLSSDSLAPPSSSHSNYVLLGESSPAPPFNSSPPDSSDGDDNYVLHGDPSPSPQAIIPAQPRPTYSQESLKVAPLRPAKKTSYERLGYLQQRSRENLRARAGSIKSIKSFSSIISEQAVQAYFAAPVLLNIPGSSSSQSTSGGGSSRQAQDSWAALQATAGSSSSPPRNSSQQRVQMLPSTPHQWSSQLSTVMSESEGSSHAGSRSVSASSAGNNNNGGGGHARRSSAGWASSMHSRQLPSISSSLAAQLEEGEGLSSLSLSRSASLASLDRPQPTYARSGGSHVRMIRDQDEHGDGLTDLEAISSKPSKSGLSGFFSSTDSGRNLHSSGSSSRANSLRGSLPDWARVYYGSGERRFLSSASIAESDHSRAGSSAVPSGSPNTDHYQLNIYSARRRTNQVDPPMEQRPFSDSADMDINVIPPQQQDYRLFRSIKRKTSSIWSPHLRTDRRASRYSIWEPPSVTWTQDSGMLGRRNAQVVLFIVGFVFPFAWMIAALLPLPTNPKYQMEEQNRNSGRFGHVNYEHQFRVFDETRYESAKWWRNLNRIMSVVGLLIIGAIVALAVVGVRQGWTLQHT